MPILENIRSCVRRRNRISRRPTKVYFNVSINNAFKSENIASQLRDLLVHIARDGVTITDLFRRPGNPQQMKRIIADLESGKQIDWTQYNFYTLANIAKRFLIHINGGLLGITTEEALLRTLELPDDQSRIEAMHRIIVSQPKHVQQLLALFFGTWFRMIYHTDVNAMSVEAVAKSVAGSIFPSCTTSLVQVERASKVMEYLITGFASVDLFGKELIEYFTRETETCISRLEKFKYEFKFPTDVPREKSVRMFMQMLLDESKKHGFDIKSDAVSRAVFDCADVKRSSHPVVSQPATTANQTCGLFSQPLDDNLPNSPIKRVSTVRSPLGVIQANKTPSNCNSSTVGDPTDRGSAHLACLGLVKQISEKHTQVLPSTSRWCFKAGPEWQQGDAHFLPSDSQSDVDMSSTCESQFHHRLISGGLNSRACFTSIRRRQLERLQKRSNWFLSPPTGVKSPDLIQLDPSVNSGASWSHDLSDGMDENDDKLDAFDSEDAILAFNSDQHLQDRQAGEMIFDGLQESSSNSLSKYPPALLHENTSEEALLRMFDKKEFDVDEDVVVRYFVMERCYGPDA